MSNDVDIGPLLLEEILAEFSEKAKTDPKLNQILFSLKKDADYLKAGDYAIRIGEVLGETAGAHISVDKLPSGKLHRELVETVLRPLLGENYRHVSQVCEYVQAELNAKAGIGLSPVVPPINKDRVDGLVSKASSYENYDQAKWVLREPIVNFSQNIVDRSIEKNVKHHARRGLSPTVIRIAEAGCCKWCTNLEGTYDYPAPKDIYRRHKRCRCTVEYRPNKKTKWKQDVWSKKWTPEASSERNLGSGQATNVRMKRLAYQKAHELGYNPLPDAKVVDVLRKDSEAWIKKLTEEEKRAINKYTFNGVDDDGLRLYQKINGFLGSKRDFPLSELKMLNKNIANIENGLLQNKLNHDIIVYRKEFLLEEATKGTIEKFLSTSVTQKGVFQGKPNMAIIVPEGTKGAYIEPLADQLVKHQREFLFNKNLQLKILHREVNFVICIVEPIE